MIATRWSLMTIPERPHVSEISLYLVTGIPGTGKTHLGNKLAKLDFQHCNLEDQTTLMEWAADPKRFVQTLLRQKKNTIVTWGFPPDHEPSVLSVLDFKQNGFKIGLV